MKESRAVVYEDPSEVCSISCSSYSPHVFWVEPSSGGCPTLTATCRQLTSKNLHQDVRSNGCHDSHCQGDGASSRSASNPAQQHDHGKHTEPHS